MNLPPIDYGKESGVSGKAGPATRRLVSAYDFDYWTEVTLKLEGMSDARSMHGGTAGLQGGSPGVIVVARGIQVEVRKWIEGYRTAERYSGEGWSVFYDDWRVVRMFIPLQLRLCAEQILYDMGTPWRSLVTGFAPVVKAYTSR